MSYAKLLLEHGIDFIRKRHLQMVSLSSISVTDDDGAYEYPIPSSDANPEDALILRQRGIMLRDIVDKLKPRYSKIVKMRYFDEMTYEEIAQQLNIPLGTVKIQLRRARMLLAQIIKTHANSL